MGDEAIAALKNKTAGNASASPSVQYQTFLPWLGATEGTLPNTIEAPAAGNNKNAGRGAGWRTIGNTNGFGMISGGGGGARRNRNGLEPGGAGLSLLQDYLSGMGIGTGAGTTTGGTDGGATDTGGATGGTPYDPGPMQGLLSQQLAAGFGGDPATYNAQLTSLYQPMTIPRIINGQDMAALKATLPKDKKTGLTGLLGYGG